MRIWLSYEGEEYIIADEIMFMTCLGMPVDW